MNIWNKYKYKAGSTFLRYVLIRLIIFSVELVINANVSEESNAFIIVVTELCPFFLSRWSLPGLNSVALKMEAIYFSNTSLLTYNPTKCKIHTTIICEYTRAIAPSMRISDALSSLVVYKCEVYYQYRVIILSVTSVCQLGYRINLAYTIDCLHARWRNGGMWARMFVR